MHAECRSRGEIGVALRVASTAIRCRAASPYVPRPRLLHNRRRSRHRYPLVSSRWSKKLIYASRDAFALGCAMISGDRIRDPMPSGMLAPFPYTMRGRSDRCSASALPVLTGGAGGQNEFKCIVNIVQPKPLLQQRVCSSLQQQHGFCLAAHAAERFCMERNDQCSA